MPENIRLAVQTRHGAGFSLLSLATARRDLIDETAATIARAGVALVPEDMGIFANLTVEENMILAAVSGPIDPARLAWLFTVFPPLKTFWKNAAGNLSGGQKQMLATARAMIEERRLHLIDEPSKGLAPAIVSTLARALRELKAQAPPS